MTIFSLGNLIFITVVSLIVSILAFSGKDIIIDDTYIKATMEEREQMDKKTYRLQSAIVFLFIFLMTLCNLIRVLTHIAWFSYAAIAICVIGIGYAIISHYAIKKKIN